MEERTYPYQIDVQSGDKPVWQHPELVFLGKLGDLVQGFGKTNPNDDSDPQNTAKQGVG